LADSSVRRQQQREADQRIQQWRQWERADKERSRRVEQAEQQRLRVAEQKAQRELQQRAASERQRLTTVEAQLAAFRASAVRAQHEQRREAYFQDLQSTVDNLNRVVNPPAAPVEPAVVYVEVGKQEERWGELPRLPTWR
jgi:molecular chaperone GrpE (heat shock protein)